MFATLICSLLALGASSSSNRKLQDCAPDSANLFDDGANCVNFLTLLSSSEVTATYTNEGVSISVAFPETQEASTKEQLFSFSSESFFAFESSSEDGDGNSVSYTFNYEYTPTVQIPLMKLLRYYKMPEDQFFNLQDLFPGFDEKYPVPEIKLEIEGPSSLDVNCLPSAITYTVNLEEYMQDDESEYSWDVFGDSVTDSLKSEVQAQTGLTLQIDSANLVEGTYFFVATVNSYYDLQFFDSHALEVKNNDSVNIFLDPQAPYEITSQDCLTIIASFEIVCYSYDTSFAWEYTPAPADRRLEYLSDPSEVITNSWKPSNILDIQAGDLEPGSTYPFTFTVVHGPITSSVEIEVVVDFSEPVANIDLVDSDFYNFQDLVLDGSCSFDVDYPEEEDRLTYQWSCQGQDGNDCLGSDGVAFDLSEESVLQIPKESLQVDAVYIFTLVVTSPSLKTASDSVTVTIKEFENQADFIVNAGEEFSIFIEVEGKVESAEWTQIYGTDIVQDRRLVEDRNLWINWNGPKKIELGFSGEGIPNGEFFGYQIDYVTEHGCGKQFVFFYTNIPVTCEGISVVPVDDEYTISVDGCVDSDAPTDGPILYSIKISKGWWSEWLMLNSESNSITGELYSGTNLIKAKVCDAYDSCLEIQDTFDTSRRMREVNTKF